MVRAARVVEQLRLRAESESAVRHALPALEDAFRTASLPDAGARLICVRRLQLGPLRGECVGAERFAADRDSASRKPTGRSSTPATRRADDAQAVWFRDALEAHEARGPDDRRGAAARRLVLAAGGAGDHGGGVATSRLRAIAFAVAAMEEAPARAAGLDGVARSRRIPRRG